MPELYFSFLDGQSPLTNQTSWESNPSEMKTILINRRRVASTIKPKNKPTEVSKNPLGLGFALDLLGQVSRFIISMVIYGYVYFLCQNDILCWLNLTSLCPI